MMVTVKILITALSGAALDYAVALHQNIEIDENNVPIWFDDERNGELVKYSPSTNWEQGGPIIENNHLSVEYSQQWRRWMMRVSITSTIGMWGDTALMAAMRSYVALKTGSDSVDIPKELINGN